MFKQFGLLAGLARWASGHCRETEEMDRINKMNRMVRGVNDQQNAMMTIPSILFILSNISSRKRKRPLSWPFEIGGGNGNQSVLASRPGAHGCARASDAVNYEDSPLDCPHPVLPPLSQGKGPKLTLSS